MWKHLGFLWREMRGQRLRYGCAIVAMVVGTLIGYLTPIVLGVSLDCLNLEKPLGGHPAVLAAVDRLGGREYLARNLWIAGLAMVVLTAFSAAGWYLKGRLSARAAEAITRRLRNRLYDHLQRLPCAYHDGAETGDLVQRATSDVETVKVFLAIQVTDLGRAVVLLATIAPILLWLDASLAVVAMSLLPVIVAFGVIFLLRVRGTFKREAEAEADLTALLQQNLTGIRVVRAFGRGEHECERFAARNAAFRRRILDTVRVHSWFWSTSDLLCLGQVALVLFVASGRVLEGPLSIGGMIVFLECVRRYIWPIRHMGRILADLGKATVAMGRIQEVLAAAPEPYGTGRRPPQGRLAGRTAFRGVTFSHGGAARALEDVSFTVEPGQTLAILGPSGAGKSTLVHLLLKLYPYRNGSIRLDGWELADLDRQFVRGQVGVVMQEPFLYSKTVRENIRLGHGPADEDQIVEAAAAACVHDAVLEFEKGYDTLVGERGVTLSGGQRQRVALARAILADPQVFVMDEATSSVDTRTEQAIQRGIERVLSGRISFVIAHRLSTIRGADRILVIDKGRIVEDGTHAELIALGRRYWELYTNQFRREGVERVLGEAGMDTAGPPRSAQSEGGEPR